MPLHIQAKNLLLSYLKNRVILLSVPRLRIISWLCPKAIISKRKNKMHTHFIGDELSRFLWSSALLYCKSFSTHSKREHLNWSTAAKRHKLRGCLYLRYTTEKMYNSHIGWKQCLLSNEIWESVFDRSKVTVSLITFQITIINNHDFSLEIEELIFVSLSANTEWLLDGILPEISLLWTVSKTFRSLTCHCPICLNISKLSAMRKENDKSNLLLTLF